jgi:hypothetical protein
MHYVFVLFALFVLQCSEGSLLAFCGRVPHMVLGLRWIFIPTREQHPLEPFRAFGRNGQGFGHMAINLALKMWAVDCSMIL